MCKDEGVLIRCWACDKPYCDRCITRILGENGVFEVLSEPEWGCFVCNVNLTTYLREEMMDFFTIAAMNGHDMSCDHSIEDTCDWLN